MGNIYVLCSTIERILSEVAEVQKTHIFALVPEEDYAGWKELPSFKREEEMEKCPDDDLHAFTDTYFIEKGCCFCVRSIKCRSSNPESPKQWRFIVDIWKDNQRLSSTNITFANFLERFMSNPS